MSVFNQSRLFRWSAIGLSVATFGPAHAATDFDSAPAVRVAEPQAGLSISATLSGSPKVGKNSVTVTLKDAAGKPLTGAHVTLRTSMTSMDMGTATSSVKDTGDGRYTGEVAFTMAGPWRVAVRVERSGASAVIKNFDFKATDGGAMAGQMDMSGMDMKMGPMKSVLGPWGMERDGSGTSWLPDSSPMFMKMLPDVGAYELSLMGSFSLNYTSTNGPRGDHRFYSNSMPMLMARRETGGGSLGINLMMSLDPIFNGETGYPDLFQTGETAHGKELVDHQHPHDLVAELSTTYSHPIGGGANAFVYAAPIGEPALGGPMFMHRPSGADIPEAPITHHWFDSTHISFGVITAGLNNSQWQVEGSVFNGHEPNENRYLPDPLGLNSFSGRVTYNPSRDLSLSSSYGFLHSPESTTPGVDQNRFTASAIYNKPLAHGDNFALTGIFGQLAQAGTKSQAYVLESSLSHGEMTYFVRWENVDKNELIGVPAGDYRVNKVLFGGVRNFAKTNGFDIGLGGYAGLYSYPSSLDPFYGKSPVTLGVFLRIRPSRMSHEMGSGM